MSVNEAFSVEIRDRPGRSRVRVAGELDLASAEAFVAEVCRALERHGRVELDLAGVSFIDAAGLRALVACRESASRSGWSLVVTAASGPVRRLFEVAQQGWMARLLGR